MTALSDATCTGVDFGGTVNVTINAAPTASTSGGGTVCSNVALPDVVFTFTGSGPFDFTYTDGTTSFPITGASSPYTIVGAAAGTYSVTALSDANCTGSDLGSSVGVIVIPAPTVLVSGGGTVCSTDALPDVTFTFSGAQPYTFTYHNGLWGTTITDYPLASFTVSNAPEGVYAITALSDANCTGSGFGSGVEVVVNDPPTADAAGPYSTCGVTPVGLAATASGPGSWSGGAGSFADATDLATTYTPNISEVGTQVTLTWTTNDQDGAGVGCDAVSAQAVVNVSACIYYSQATGDVQDDIWDVVPVGTAGPAVWGPGSSMVVQAGHVVTNVDDVSVNDVTVDPSGILALTSFTTFTVHGDQVVLNGTVAAQVDSELELVGAEAVALSCANPTSFWNLTVNTQAGTTVTGTVIMRGTLQLDNGNFNCTGNPVVLRSTATATGRLGSVPATASYTGHMNIERYIPAGATNWRLLGSPIANRKVKHWRDDFITAGYPGSHYPNFDSPVGSGILWPSIRWYDEADPGAGEDDGMQGVSSNEHPLTMGQGFAAARASS